MPAVSEKQRRLMAIAEHSPGKVNKENRGVLSMSHGQLHDFAATKGLHEHPNNQHNNQHPVKHLKRRGKA